MATTLAVNYHPEMLFAHHDRDLCCWSGDHRESEQQFAFPARPLSMDGGAVGQSWGQGGLLQYMGPGPIKSDTIFYPYNPILYASYPKSPASAIPVQSCSLATYFSLFGMFSMLQAQC